MTEIRCGREWDSLHGDEEHECGRIAGHEGLCVCGRCNHDANGYYHKKGMKDA